MQQVTASALFASFFYLVLRSSTFFRLNRFYLLGAMLGAVVIPFISIPSFIPVEAPTLMVMLDEIVVGEAIEQSSIGINWYVVAYFLVVGVLLLRMLAGISAAVRLLKRSETQIIEGAVVYVSDEKVNPFSFFNRILINRELLGNQQDLEAILKHESTHLTQGHSFDVLFSELICSLFWFNPIFWLLKKELKSTHEYLADETVLEQDADLAGYFLLIFNNLLGRNVGLTNNFNHSLNFKRMKMMKKKRSSLVVKVMSFAALPFLLVFGLILSGQFANANKTAPNKEDLKGLVVIGYAINNASSESPATALSDKKIDAVPQKKVKGEIYEVVDVMPEYPGGTDALMQFLRTSVKYPVEAQKNGVEGKVFVEFVVDKEGKIRNASALRVNVKSKGEAELENVKQSASSGARILSKEALRVVNTMPDWTPGKKNGKAVNVQYRLPITFALK